MVNRRALSFIPDGRAFGFDDLMRQFLSIGETVHVEPYAGYWMDIGRPDDYQAAVADCEAVPGRFS